MSTIDPAVFSPDDVPTVENSEHYRIKGINEADWALRKVAKAQAEMQANTDLAKDEIARVTAWHEDANKNLQSTVDYFTAILTHYHEEKLEGDPKAKTITLPGGKLVARKTPDKVDVTDEEVFFEWANLNHPEWIDVKSTRSPKKSDIKAAIKETGEVVPGVKYVEGDVKFSVEAS